MPKKVTWKPVVWRSGLPQYARRLDFDQKIRDFEAKFNAMCHVVPPKPRPDPRCDIWLK